MQQSPHLFDSRTKEEGGLPKNQVLWIHITSIRIRNLFLVMQTAANVLQNLHGFILSLYVSTVGVYGPSLLHF
jgi:hypothetical protein